LLVAAAGASTGSDSKGEVAGAYEVKGASAGRPAASFAEEDTRESCLVRDFIACAPVCGVAGQGHGAGTSRFVLRFFYIADPRPRHRSGDHLNASD
jgi:hypothetical protein